MNETTVVAMSFVKYRFENILGLTDPKLVTESHPVYSWYELSTVVHFFSLQLLGLAVMILGCWAHVRGITISVFCYWKLP